MHLFTSKHLQHMAWDLYIYAGTQSFSRTPSLTETQYSVLPNLCVFLRPSKSSQWGGWSSFAHCVSLFVLGEVKERPVNRMQAVTALWALWLPMYSFQVASAANSLLPDTHTHDTNSLYNEACEKCECWPLRQKGVSEKAVKAESLCVCKSSFSADKNTSSV